HAPAAIAAIDRPSQIGAYPGKSGFPAGQYGDLFSDVYGWYYGIYRHTAAIPAPPSADLCSQHSADFCGYVTECPCNSAPVGEEETPWLICLPLPFLAWR